MDNPERDLALSYAPVDRRPALAALFALDDVFARIVATTREPALGAMRLVWWRDALERLDSAPPPAEPVLQALAANVLPLGVSGADLSLMEEGWTAVLPGQPLDKEALETHARERGRRLFTLAADLLGCPTDLGEGEGWALNDLAVRSSDVLAADKARLLGRDRLGVRRWPRALRSLGALVVLARMDANTTDHRPGSPGRVGRLLWLRLTGR